MNTNATPGPWHATDCRHQKNGQIRIFGRYAHIANVLAHDAQCEANAQLIAAAPELFAALERAVPWLGKMIADGAHLGAVLPRDCEMALAQADAAIKKAQGER